MPRGVEAGTGGSAGDDLPDIAAPLVVERDCANIPLDGRAGGGGSFLGVKGPVSFSGPDIMD